MKNEGEKRQRLEDNEMIIGNKPIEIYLATVVKMFCTHNHIIIKVPRGKIDIANLIVNNFKWCANEDRRRWDIKVTTEHGGQKFKFDAKKIRLDLFPTLRVSRE